MKIIRQLTLIFLLCLCGNLLASFLPIPIPGSILGMLLLLVLLFSGLMKDEQLSQVGDYLLANMAFFFIPAGVGILESYALILDKLPQILLICLLSTVITFFATAYTVKGMVRILGKKEER